MHCDADRGLKPEVVGADGGLPRHTVDGTPGDDDGKEGDDSDDDATSVATQQQSATVAVSGNPLTDIRHDLGPHFDVVFLPDFNEQYAISADSPLGTATASLGLENGWLMENISIRPVQTEYFDFNIFKFQQVVNFIRYECLGKNRETI